MTDKYSPPYIISYTVYDKNGQKLEMRYAIDPKYCSKMYYDAACNTVYLALQEALKLANAKT